MATPASPKWRHPRHRRFQVGLRLSIRVSGPPASRGQRPTRGDRGFRVQSPSQSRQSVSGRPAGPSFPPRLPTRDWNSPTQDPGPGRRLQHSSTDRHSGLQPLENSSPPKGVQGGRRYTEEVLIPRPLAKSNQVRSMSLARVMFFGSHPPSSRKQGGDSRNDPLVGICTAYNGWHPLQLFLYEISCQQRPDQSPLFMSICPRLQCKHILCGKGFSMVAIEKGQVFFWEESARPPAVGAHPGGPGCPGESPGRGWLGVRMVVSSVENH